MRQYYSARWILEEDRLKEKEKKELEKKKLQEKLLKEKLLKEKEMKEKENVLAESKTKANQPDFTKSIIFKILIKT